MLGFVRLQKLGDLGYERVVWVGISEQRTDGQENFGNGQGGRPLLLQDVEADATVRMDVAMVNSCRECDLWWFEGVVRWEVNVQEEDASRVWRLIRAHDGCLPSELVFLIEGTSRAISRWVLSKIDEFLLDALECHLKFLMK